MIVGPKVPMKYQIVNDKKEKKNKQIHMKIMIYNSCDKKFRVKATSLDSFLKYLCMLTNIQ